MVVVRYLQFLIVAALKAGGIPITETIYLPASRRGSPSRDQWTDRKQCDSAHGDDQRDDEEGCLFAGFGAGAFRAWVARDDLSVAQEMIALVLGRIGALPGLNFDTGLLTRVPEGSAATLGSGKVERRIPRVVD